MRDVDPTTQIWVPRQGWAHPKTCRGICNLQAVLVDKVRPWVRKRVRMLDTQDGFVMIMLREPRQWTGGDYWFGRKRGRLEVRSTPRVMAGYQPVWYIGLMHWAVGGPNDFYYQGAAKKVHPGLFDEV